MVVSILRDSSYTWPERVMMLLAFLVAIYFAIVLHEVAHGLVALWNGDPTAKYNRRLTLNPVRHIDPIGAVMMLFVGIGWAKPVPVDPRNFKNFKRGMVTVSLAGVCTNLILAFVSFGMYVAMGAIARNVQQTSQAGYLVLFLFTYLFLYSTVLNISLIAFNLLPIAPLDGFRLVESFTRPNNGYVRFMYRYGRYIFLGLIALGVLADATGLPCDVLGMYISAVQRGILTLFNLIFGVG